MTKKKPDGFIGRFDRKIGRDKLLTIPAEWVARLGEYKCVYVLPSRHRWCLNILSHPLMEKKLEYLRSIPMKSAEDFEALKVIGAACECLEMDRRHRVRISDRMLEHVGITDRAVLVAGARQIEAWNPERLRRKE